MLWQNDLATTLEEEKQIWQEKSINCIGPDSHC
jgi:hypothetical protein